MTDRRGRGGVTNPWEKERFKEVEKLDNGYFSFRGITGFSRLDAMRKYYIQSGIWVDTDGSISTSPFDPRESQAEGLRTPAGPEVAVATIEEIHEDFRGTVDKLLEEAKAILNKPQDKKAERYANLGFKNAPGVQEEETARREREAKEVLLNKINDYRVRYPRCQFIDNESLDALCKKYGLVYASAEYFNQEIPEENLKEIEAFELDDGDKMYEYTAIHTTGHSLTVSNKEDLPEWDNFQTETSEVNTGFEVVATKDMFDVPSDQEFYGSTLRAVVNDPIVLKRVPLGFLIITAWGPEAELPEVNINNQ